MSVFDYFLECYDVLRENRVDNPFTETLRLIDL